MQTFIEFLAVISGAMFGVLLARRKRMDFVGVFSVAFLTAFGGGTLRDLLLGRHPLFWIENSHYSVVVFVVAAVAALLPNIPLQFQRWLSIPDAFGMAMFSAVGTDLALQAPYSTSPFVAVLLGVITGTFGGVMGDVVCNDVPSLFKPSTPLYGTCAFLGGCTMVGCHWIQIPQDLALWLSSAMALAVRLVALRYNLCLKAVDQPCG